MSDKHDKTEKATPKRREDAKKKGQIARGAELPAAFSLLVSGSFCGECFRQGSLFQFRRVFSKHLAHKIADPACIYYR